MDARVYTLLFTASRTVPYRLKKAAACKAKLRNHSRQYNYFVFLFKKQSLHVRSRLRRNLSDRMSGKPPGLLRSVICTSFSATKRSNPAVEYFQQSQSIRPLTYARFGSFTTGRSTTQHEESRLLIDVRRSEICRESTRHIFVFTDSSCYTTYRFSHTSTQYDEAHTIPIIHVEVEPAHTGRPTSLDGRVCRLTPNDPDSGDFHWVGLPRACFRQLLPGVTPHQAVRNDCWRCLTRHPH